MKKINISYSCSFTFQFDLQKQLDFYFEIG